VAFWVRSQIAGEVARRKAGSPLRLSLRGLPSSVASEVMADLLAEGIFEVSHAGAAYRVLILHVRPGVPHRVGVQDGECNVDYANDIRNNTNPEFQRFLMIVDPGVALSEGLKGTSEEIGLAPDREWSKTDLVCHLIGRIREGMQEVAGGLDSFAPALLKALRDADSVSVEGDYRAHWTLLERIYDATFGLKSIDSLVRVLGLPYTDDPASASAAILALPERIGSFLKKCTSIAGELKDRALKLELNVASRDALLAAIDSFSTDAIETALSGGAFAEAPRHYLGLMSEPALGSESVWWRIMSAAVWLKLLDEQLPAAPSDLPITWKEGWLCQSGALAVYRNTAGLVLDRTDLELPNLGVSVGSTDAVVWNAAKDPSIDLSLDFSHKTPVKVSVAADEHWKPRGFRVVVLTGFVPGVVVSCSSSGAIGIPRVGAAGRLDATLDLVAGGGSITVHFDESRLQPDINENERLSAGLVAFDYVEAGRFDVFVPPDGGIVKVVAAFVGGDGRKVTLTIGIREAEPETECASEFERLIARHLGKRSVAVQVNDCWLRKYEAWSLEDPERMWPSVLGPDFDAVLKLPRDVDASNYMSRLRLSAMQLQSDPRPGQISVPPDFLRARERVLEFIRATGQPLPEIELASVFSSADAKAALAEYLKRFIAWREGYPAAAWIDIIGIMDEGAGHTLKKMVGVLVAPWHPLRLAWQVSAQERLSEGLVAPCPAVALVEPSFQPSCIGLPIKQPAGGLKTERFVALRSTDPYWQVLWCDGQATDLLYLALPGRSNSTRTLGDRLGITVEPVAAGFGAPQVSRVLDDLADIRQGSTWIRLGLGGSSDSAAREVNDGIGDWVLSSLCGSDPWAKGSGATLEVFDFRDTNLQPIDDSLAYLTELSNERFLWWDKRDATSRGNGRTDVHLFGDLGDIQSQRAEGARLFAARSGRGLFRIAPRQVIYDDNSLPFVLDALVTREGVSPDGNALTSLIRQAIFDVEKSAGLDATGFYPAVPVVSEALSRASFCAFSSAGVDHATLASLGDSTVVWDYDLPAFERGGDPARGYFLVAAMGDDVIAPMKTCLSELGISLESETLSSVVTEMSRRGVPALKRLALGGSSARGEIGMLCALRALQPIGSAGVGAMPLVSVDAVHLLIPLDPFTKQIRALKKSSGFSGSMPDFLGVRVEARGNAVSRILLCPIEAKLRTDPIAVADLNAAMEQAGELSRFLDAHLRATGDGIWNEAIRSFLAVVLDFGFRAASGLVTTDRPRWQGIHAEAVSSVCEGTCPLIVQNRPATVVFDLSNPGGVLLETSDSKADVLHVGRQEVELLLAGDELAVPSGVRDWFLVDQQPSSLVNVDAVAVGAEKGSDDQSAVPSGVEKPSRLSGASDAPHSSRDDKKSAEGAAGVRQTDLGHQPLAFAVGVRSAGGGHVYRFEPGKTSVNQLNVGIVGDLGTGKTQLVKALVRQITHLDSQNFGVRPSFLILDYKKDYSEEHFVKEVGAKVWRPRRLPINPLMGLGGGDSFDPALQAAFQLFDLMKKLYGGVGPVQETLLRQAVRSAYKSAESTGKSPSLAGVLEAYKSQKESVDSVVSILESYIDAEIFDDGASAVDLSEFFSGVVVIDLGYFGPIEQLKTSVVVFLLNAFYQYMLGTKKRQPIAYAPGEYMRSVHSFLLVDEADGIMQHDFPVLRQLLLQGREFGFGTMLSTQYLSHFSTGDNKYAEPLLTWFIHKVPSVSVSQLSSVGVLDPSPEMARRIQALPVHHCLYKTPGVKGDFIRATPFFELVKD
jgi:hypothetical protein